VSNAAPLRPGTLTSLNIGTGVGTDVVTLEAALRESVGGLLESRGSPTRPPAPVHGPARPGDLRSSLVDATLAGAVLGWRAEVPLEAGIARTAEWFADRAAAGA
jgi:UDP-glucose 4-epimerase